MDGARINLLVHARQTLISLSKNWSTSRIEFGVGLRPHWELGTKLAIFEVSTTQKYKTMVTWMDETWYLFRI